MFFQTLVIAQNNILASPDKIKLDGTIKSDSIVTSLGRMEVRWSLNVEKLFGRTPVKALTEAASVANRTLMKAGFPVGLNRVSPTWNVVFMDENIPQTQVPTSLISNCHPGWYTPPGNIYIVAQRVASGCNKSKGAKVNHEVADGILARVLVHEIGHGIEFKLLGNRMNGDRMRGEGFATWFERLASEDSSMMQHKVYEDYYMRAAAVGLLNGGITNFQGTPEHYAVASMIFSTLQTKRRISGVMNLYQLMNDKGLSFEESIKESFGLDFIKLQKHIEEFIDKAN